MGNEIKDEVLELRKACTSDALTFVLKREADKLDNDMMSLKTRVKENLQSIIDYNAGLSNVDVRSAAEEIYNLRIRMNEIHIKREALANTKSELIELGLVCN